MCAGDSRHDDDAEVEPVPGVPEEGEGPHTETPGQDLYEGLEGVDAREGVPERGRPGEGKRWHDRGKQTKDGKVYKSRGGKGGERETEGSEEYS